MAGTHTGRAFDRRIGGIAASIFLLAVQVAYGGKPPDDPGQAAALAARIADIAQRIQSDDGAVRSRAIEAMEELAATRTLDKKTLDKKTLSQLHQLENVLLDSVRRHIVGKKKAERQKAFHQIIMLGDLRVKKSIPLLVKHLEFVSSGRQKQPVMGR